MFFLLAFDKYFSLFPDRNRVILSRKKTDYLILKGKQVLSSNFALLFNIFTPNKNKNHSALLGLRIFFSS